MRDILTRNLVPQLKYCYIIITICILVGPDLDFGPEERAVLLGDSLSLLCGTNLMSNPPSANITWLDPLGNKVVDDDRYNLINDDTGVRLELNGSRANDVGVWMCIVSVEGSDVTLPSGETRSSFVVGMKMLNISLQVVGKLHVEKRVLLQFLIKLKVFSLFYHTSTSNK